MQQPLIVKRTGPETAERAALYREIFEHATDGVAILDLAGRYVEQNAAHEAITGYTSAELVGRTPAVHLGEATFARIAEELKRTGHYRGEHESRAADGTVRVLELSAFAVRDDQGAVRYYVGAKRDISQRRQAEATLQRRYDQLQAMYEMTAAVNRASALPEIYEVALTCLERAIGADRSSVLLFDERGEMRFVAWHGLSDEYRRAVEGHSPWPQDAVDPQPITFSDVSAAAELGELRSVIEREGIGAIVFIPLRSQDRLLGKFMLYFDAPHEFVDEELQLARTVASQIGFSITRQRHDDELKAANQAKSAFLATMSHELRTPLNAILGYADLLGLGVSGGLNELQVSHIDRIRTSALHLINVIEEILTFSRAEAGKEEVAVSAVDLAAFVSETASLIEPIATSKGLELHVAAEDRLGAVQTDARKLRQILLNLLGNAVKFTDSGSVTLRADRSNGRVRLVVADTGRGIAPEDHARVFEPFWQGDQGATRRSGGTGLGLTVTAQLVDLLGGRIHVESELGAGTRFTVELPVQI